MYLVYRMKILPCVFFLMVLVCVDPKKQHSGRIGEGQVLTDPTKYPFFVISQIREYPNPDLGRGCGGSLIHPQWILTAGHCVPNTTEEIAWVLKLNKPMVFMGSVIPPWVDYNANENYIIEIRLHPNYREEIHYINGQKDERVWNDVALVKLKYPYEMSDTIQTIELATTFGLCQYCTIIGLGLTILDDPNSRPNITKYAKTLIREYDDLSSKPIYKRDTAFYTETKYGGDDFPDSGYGLEGDSGGPAICELYGGKTPILIGVMSTRSIVRSFLGYPERIRNALERVDLHMDFIKQYVPELNIKRKGRTKHISKSNASCKKIKLFPLFVIIAVFICNV